MIDVTEPVSQFVEPKPVDRYAAHPQRAWPVAQRARRTMLVSVAVTTALLVVAGTLLATNRPGGPSQTPAAQPPRTALSTPVGGQDGDLEARRATVQAELAAHPAWPQRQITLKGRFLVFPFSPGDPQAYLDWLVELGWRYDGAVKRDYVQDNPGAPSLAQLDEIKTKVWAELMGLNTTLPALALAKNPELGRVELHHDPTTDAAFLNVIERARQTYGALFDAQASGGPSLGAGTARLPVTRPEEPTMAPPQAQRR